MKTPPGVRPAVPGDELIAGDPIRGASSLERRLPLMISGLLAITLVAFGVLAFTELRQSSMQTAMVQVRTLVTSTRDNLARVVAQRLTALENVAKHPAIIRAATAGATVDVDAATQILRARLTPADTISLTGAVLVDSRGQRVEVAGSPFNQTDLAELDSAVAGEWRSDSARASSLYVVDSIVRYWVVAPVRQSGRTLGFIAERRQLRPNGGIESQLRDLTAQDLSVHYAATDNSVWIGLRGVPTAAKFDVRTVTDTFHTVSANNEALIGAKSEIRGLPLALVFSIPQSSVYQRANEFLQRMIMTGVALLALSMLGAWLISRRVTAPLKSLTLAARQIARGNYSPREPVKTDDEIGELAQAFNRMAQRIGDSHALLAVRIEESEKLAQELHKASRAKSEFLAMMSHELRTPLSAIAGYAEILQLGMRGNLNEAQSLDLSRIQANQVHLLRIINDILDLAQVESGQLQVSSQPVAVRDVINDVEPIVLPLVAGRDIRYAVDEYLCTLTVLAERDKLTQVLVNLIANAVRFTEAGGTIRVHGEAVDHRIRIHVTDSGMGIAPEKLEAIFQPFVQAEGGASRRAQGTGLGLTISRRIAEAMGGTLTVKSVPKEGSTFTLELAAATETFPADGVGISETSVTKSAPSLRRSHAIA